MSARDEAALHLTRTARAHLDAGNPSLAIAQLIGAVETLAHSTPEPAKAPSLNAATPDRERPRRPNVRVLLNLRPRRCVACGPDCSPHDATLWLQWGEGAATTGRAACERTAVALQLQALASQVQP